MILTAAKRRTPERDTDKERTTGDCQFSALQTLFRKAFSRKSPLVQETENVAIILRSLYPGFYFLCRGEISPSTHRPSSCSRRAKVGLGSIQIRKYFEWFEVIGMLDSHVNIHERYGVYTDIQCVRLTDIQVQKGQLKPQELQRMTQILAQATNIPKGPDCSRLEKFAFSIKKYESQEKVLSHILYLLFYTSQVQIPLHCKRKENLFGKFIERERMDFELRRAREKLEQEQRERKQKAKLKLEREKKAKQEAIRQREAIEAVQRARRLDAAEAQAKVTQQIEEELLAGRGVAFSRVLEAVLYEGAGDKIKLPPSCFTELSDQGAFDKGPLHVRVSAIHQSSPSDLKEAELNNRTTHAGVLEFTADDGVVGLPSHIWSNLYPAESPMVPMVEICYVWLPKGTYAKLQPVEAGFSDIPNHKAVLETSLRQHATLSEGDVLTVSHGVLTYHLRVLELKPSSSVSVLETDIEVDVIGADPTAESTSQPVLQPLELGKLDSGVVAEGSYVYYKFQIDNDNWGKISSGYAEIEVKIESENQDGDTDLYVSRHPLLFPTLHQHGWSSHDIGSKTLVLDSRDLGLGPGTYSIGIYGFKGTTKYKVSVSIRNKSKIGQQAVSSALFADADTVECPNCKHYIPSRSIALHEAYCRRHNIICQHTGCGVVLRRDEVKNHVHCEECGIAFQKEEIEKHKKVFHVPLNCPCGIVLEKEKMVQHQSLECPLRLVTCRFCGDMVQAGTSAADARDRLRGLTQHESVCGSRTAPCDSCGRSVMLKDMDIHQVAVHQKN